MKRKLCIMLTMAAILSTFSGPITTEAAEPTVRHTCDYTKPVNIKKRINGTYTHDVQSGTSFGNPVYITCKVTTYIAEYLLACKVCDIIGGSGSSPGETHGSCKL